MPAKIESKTSYSEEFFKRLELTNTRINGTEFSECKFSRCDFSDSAFTSCRFMDCIFEDCSLKMTKIEDSSFIRVQFKNCNLLGIDWTEANWSAKIGLPSFEACDLKYNIFYGLDLKKLKLKNSHAREANFAEANLSEADFEGTDFAGANFQKTDISKANFVGAKNYAFKLSDNKVKGAKFSLPEASRLLFYMDIQLIDPETKKALDEDELET